MNSFDKLYSSILESYGTTAQQATTQQSNDVTQSGNKADLEAELKRLREELKETEETLYGTQDDWNALGGHYRHPHAGYPTIEGHRREKELIKRIKEIEHTLDPGKAERDRREHEEYLAHTAEYERQMKLQDERRARALPAKNQTNPLNRFTKQSESPPKYTHSVYQ
jgi:hypothetical protein